MMVLGNVGDGELVVLALVVRGGLCGEYSSEG